MKRKILNVLLTAAIVFAFLPGAAPIQANPALSTPTTNQPRTGSYYLEFDLPEAPLSYASERVESWFFDRFMDALQQLHPQLLAYIEQGALEDFSVDQQQFRLTLVNPASFVLDELRRLPEVLGIYPTQGGVTLQSDTTQPESQTLRRMEEMVQRQEMPPEEPSRTEPIANGMIEPAAALSAGHFTVVLWESRVYGYTSTAYASFTTSVTRDSVLIAEFAGSSDYSGYYSFYLSDFSGNDVLLQPGDVVTVTAVGDPVNSFVLPEIIVQVNATQDVVGMYAPANQPVSIITYTNTGAYTLDGTTSPEGVFIADFTSQADVLYDDDGWVYFTDALGTQNQVSMHFETPELHGGINYSYVYGHTGQTGAGTHQVLITQYNADGSYSLGVLVDADNTGYFRADLYLTAPDSRLEFTAPSGEQVILTYPNITVTADSVTNTVSGQALPNVALDVQLRHMQTDTWYFDDVTTDASGFYSTNFDGLVNISPRDYTFAIYTFPDGHWVYAYYRVPYLTINRVSSVVTGYIAPNEDVTVYLKDSLGAIKATDSYHSSSSGYFYVNFWEGIDNTPIDILTGDSIQIVSLSTSMVIGIPLLSANVDQAADTISGQAVPNMAIETNVCNRTAYYVGITCYIETTQADSSGWYLISYSGYYDIHAGDQITLYYTTLEEQLIQDYFYLPNRVFVNQWDNYATVYTTASSTVEVTLRDNGGEVKAFFNGSSSYTGYLYLGTLGDIATGDTLTVEADGVTTQVTIADLQVTSYDRLNNVITGRGPANARLAYYLRDANSSDYYRDSILLDTAGNFTIYLSGLWDLRGSDRIDIQYIDQTGSAQYLYSYIPGMTVNLVYNQVSGIGMPSSTVVVYLKDSAGNLKSSAQATVSGTSWYVYFEVDILPGDILEMHNAGLVSSMTVQELIVTADPLTDVVSGSAPANSWVYLYGRNYDQSYETYLATGTDGSFSQDLSAVFDVLNLTYLDLEWYSSEGDGIQTYTYIPGINVHVSYNYGSGYSSTPDTLIDLTLRDDGGVKATAQVATSSSGSFYTNGFCDGSLPVDIVPGDTLASPDTDVLVIATSTVINVDSNTISGTTTPNALLLIAPESGSGAWYYGSWQVMADAGGAFSLDLSGTVDLVPGDYATISWYDGEGNRVYFVATSVSNTGAVAITSVPDAARPNSPVYIGWQTSGGLNQSSTYLRWDTVSHACDHNYRNYADAYSSDAGQYSGVLTAPAAGTIYLAAYAYIDGYRIWSPEVAIPVADMAPVITDPVNGTTNDSTPTLQGFGPAGEVVEFYRNGSILLGSTTISAEGTFSYTLPGALSNTEHLITARVPSASLTSNTVYLTVDSNLLVDPNHIFFTDRGVRFRIHDEAGYANLGGRIWIRPNDTVQIELPVRTCSDPFGVTLTVGAVVYDMFYAGDEVWVGSFLLPSSDYAIIANINCGGTNVNILLTYGLIDPDGYVYVAEAGTVLSGALVTCYAYSEDSGQYEVWDAATWDQINPQWTDADGYYSFIVPPGEYKVEATYPGFLMNASPPLTVVDEPVHYNIPLSYQIIYRLILPLINK